MRQDLRHVALVVESWGKGGTETYVAGLVRALTEQDVNVSLILLQDGNQDLIDFLDKENIVVLGFKDLLLWLRKNKPDSISLHLYTHLLQVVLIAKIANCRVVSTLHMPINSWGVRHRLLWKTAIILSDQVVGVSKLVLKQLSSRKIFSQSLPGGVDHHFFLCKREAINEVTHGFFIAAIGRLAQEKDWPTLIQAVSILPEKLRAKCVISFYGDGQMLPLLKKLAKQVGVNAQFYGFIKKETLVEHLARSHISVLPSRFEGLGLSAIESMAASVPTICANFPAASEFIDDGITGHLFSIEDAAALAKLIQWHMEHPQQSQAIGLAGRESVQDNFSEDVVYIPYFDLL